MNFKRGSNLGCVPPPDCLKTNTNKSQQQSSSYHTMSSIMSNRSQQNQMPSDEAKRKEEQYAALVFSSYGSSSAAHSSAATKRKNIYDDEYLERDDEDEELAYQPAPGSPSAADSNAQKDQGKNDSDDEDDPLDAFMADINKQAEKDIEDSEKHEREKGTKAEKSSDKKKLGRTDIDEEDMQESYFRYLEEKKSRAGQEEDEEIFEYDDDGNIIWSWKKVIDPLPPIDHSAVDYAPFTRCFYAEHEDIKCLNHVQVEELRRKLGVKVTGVAAPKPVCSFAHFGFDNELMGVIRKSEYTQPTPIQAQGIPTALSGRDVIGIAKTGSGKTAAYLWPALVHIMDQRELSPEDGPIALIVVPTRELAIQVYHEAKRFGKVYNVNVVCAYGGGSKWEQQNALAEGAEIVVGTPGRIIDLVKIGATNLTRVTFLVFDEADRMFDMGFEPQVRSIANHVRPDRQCLMFSATFKKSVERLARDALIDPIRIVQGELGEANADVIQTVEVLSRPEDKWTWLIQRLVKFSSIGKVLIFVTKKQNSEELAQNLKNNDYPLCLLHGDMQQYERNETIAAFRKDIPILVATDVAARGLDIPQIKTVINYDVARDIDTHVHRIGRTGRAGKFPRGERVSLYAANGERQRIRGPFGSDLESVNQSVPHLLMRLAMQVPWFRKNRNDEGKLLNDGSSGIGSGPNRLGLASSKGPGPDWVGSSAKGHEKSAGARALEDALSIAQAKGGGGGSSATNRLASVKAAFQASYKSTFQSSSSNELPGRANPSQSEQNTTDESGVKKKRSRWD